MIIQKKNFLIRILFYIFFLNLISLSYSEQELNGIIVFDSDHYRAGNFAINKNNDMFIEYSYQNKRLFYGLQQNGRYYFKDESRNLTPTKSIIIVNNENSLITQRYESKNIFISLKNDINEVKQYLFSTSSYTTVSELFDLENLENEHNIVKATSNFLGKEIFSFQFSLLELVGLSEKEYILIYSTSTTSDPGEKISLKKFKFSEYSFNNYETSNDKEINNYYNRLVSAFTLNNSLIIVFHIDNAEFKIKIFNYNLDQLSDIGTNIIQDTTNYNSDKSKGRGLGYYLKCIYLKDNTGIFSFYIYNDYHYPYIMIGKIVSTNNEQNYSFDTIIKKQFNYYQLQAEYLLNDIIKINDNRFSFISSSDNRQILYIFLFDLYNNDKNMKLRVFKSNINDYKMVKEFSSVIFNNYLVFTSTVIDKNEDNYYNDDICKSILLIFGFPNTDDKEIDISSYLMDIENYDKSNNIYNDLMKNMTIENNIFGYEKIEKIKLISYPKEILFYNEINETISFEDFLDINSKLFQNLTMIKQNKYYYIEFQYIVKDINYNELDNYVEKKEIFDLTNNGNNIEQSNSDYEEKNYYGRVITIKFKLCYELCETCSSLGITEEDQKCITCIEKYVNDYLIPSNCIKEGYYKNGEELIKCTETNSKFYYNEYGKKICFNSNLECPQTFSDYDPVTKECKKTVIKTSILSTYFNHISTLITTSIKFNPMPTIPTTYSNTKPQTTILTTSPKIHTTEINIHITNIKSTLINNPIISNLIISSSFTSDIDNSNTIIEPSTCNYFLLIEKLCSYENYTNSEIYEKLKKEIIPTYPPDGISIIIEGKNNTVFQLTTNKNEINSLNGSNINKYNLSIIDLTELEKLLNKKEDNTYNENIPLIIFKYEKYNTPSSEKNIQYEIYDQNTKDKLNLSIYNNEINTIDIYIPITFDEKIKNLYIDLNNSGYDLLDINNCFYNDICTPYKSEYDTDVLLSDRIKDYYMNKALCQSNCKYSKYFYLENILKCKCYIDDKNINISKLGEYDDKLFIENIYKNQKNSNFKSMKCTNLIFRGKSFKKNIGCIIMFLYFLLYLVFVIIYIIQRLNPLKIKEIKIILNIEENDLGNNNIQNTINYDENKINDNNKNNVKINDLKNKDEKNKNNLTLNENNINENSKEKFTDNVKKENKIISDDTTYNNIIF